MKYSLPVSWLKLTYLKIISALLAIPINICAIASYAREIATSFSKFSSINKIYSIFDFKSNMISEEVPIRKSSNEHDKCYLIASSILPASTCVCALLQRTEIPRRFNEIVEIVSNWISQKNNKFKDHWFRAKTLKLTRQSNFPNLSNFPDESTCDSIWFESVQWLSCVRKLPLMLGFLCSIKW